MEINLLTRFRLKIEYARANLDGVLQSIIDELDNEPFPAELVPAVIQSYQVGAFVYAPRLARVIADTGSESLYRLAVLRNDFNVGHFAMVFAAGHRFPNLEAKLVAGLYAIFADDGNPLRTQIVSAMLAAGGQESLDALQSIALEMADAIPARRAALDYEPLSEASLDVIRAIEIKCSHNFWNFVYEAIAAIQGRLP